MKQHTGFFKEIHRRRFCITPDYFQFYNSFNATLSQGDNKTSEVLYEYQQKTKLGLVLWFLHRNFFLLFGRIILVIIFFWLCFGGGIVFLLNSFLGYSGKIQRANTPASVDSISSDIISNDILPDDIVLEDVVLGDSVSDSEDAISNDIISNDILPAVVTDEPVSEKKDKLSYLKFLSPEYAILGNGDYLFPGMSFVDEHKYKGYHVSEINYKLGYVSLRSSSGSFILRLQLSND